MQYGSILRYLIRPRFCVEAMRPGHVLLGHFGIRQENYVSSCIIQCCPWRGGLIKPGWATQSPRASEGGERDRERAKRSAEDKQPVPGDMAESVTDTHVFSVWIVSWGRRMKEGRFIGHHDPSDVLLRRLCTCVTCIWYVYVPTHTC